MVNNLELNAISVYQFSNYICGILENEAILQNINIMGEISSYNERNNIAYFQIKDTMSVLDCMLFNCLSLSYKAKIGEKVIVSGSPNYYIKGGKFNFKCYQIKPLGEGDLFKQFKLMKSKLEKEGLFDLEHKKMRPSKIKDIGVVTSKQGAVIQDIINVTTRRDPSINIHLYPVKVQGIGSEIEIAKGIDFFNNYDVDVVIVARGGGSSEDLLAFNTEVVARATYNSNKFIVSAVGHETDYTIIDYVADERAPTPSAAAEILTKDRTAEFQSFKNTIKQLNQSFNNILIRAEENTILQNEKMENFLEIKIGNLEDEIINKLKDMNNLIDRKITDEIAENKKNQEILSISNPQNIMNRGYVKLEKNNKSISSISELKLDDSIDIMFYDGKASAKIESIGGKKDDI